MSVSFEERLQMSYVHENGSKLLLGFARGFSTQQVIPSQIGMLQANRIAGVLPFQAEVIDGRYRFRYELSGLRKFEPVLRSAGLNDEQSRGWLFHLFSTIRSHKQYLLDEEGFIIHPDYIWINHGTDVNEFLLLYVPLKNVRRDSTLWHQWNELYLCFIRNGVSKEALSDLDPRRWPPETFSLQQLIEVLEAPVAGSQSPESGAAMRQSDPMSKEKEHIAGPSLSDDGETMRFEKPQLLNRKTLFIALSAVSFLGFLATWEWVWLCAAILSSVLFAFKGTSIFRPLNTVKDEKPNEARAITTTDAQQNMLKQAASIPIPEGTTWLTPRADETMLLSAGVGGSMAKEAWLEIRFPGQSEGKMVPVTENSFFVGRGPQGVHVVTDQPGTSRVHLELRKLGEEYAVIDVGSKNGTFYNTEPMVAFQPYLLKTGDTMRLPGIQLIFHVLPKE